MLLLLMNRLKLVVIRVIIGGRFICESHLISQLFLLVVKKGVTFDVVARNLLLHHTRASYGRLIKETFMLIIKLSNQIYVLIKLTEIERIMLLRLRMLRLLVL